VKIGIIDTGLDDSHPEFGGVNVNGTNLLYNGEDWRDRNGHGTAVAGIIGAANGNGGMNGILGIDPSRYQFNIYRNGGYYLDDTVDYFASALAMIIAAGHVDVANLSFNFPLPGSTQAVPVLWNNAQAFLQAVVAVPNTVWTVGAGNDNMEALGRWPIGNTHSRFIIVAGSNETDGRWVAPLEGSNFGAISLAAPASNVTTTDLGGAYRAFDKTSAAAPLVAGAASLLIQIGVPHDQVKSVLVNSGKSIQTDKGTWRRLDLCRAVAQVLPVGLLRLFAESVGVTPTGTFPPSDLYRLDAYGCGSDTRIGRIATTSGFEPLIWDIALAPDLSLWGVSPQELYRIDTLSGIAFPKPLQGLPAGESPNALAFDQSGTLFAATIPSGIVLQIDTATGATTTKGSFGGGLSSLGDLAFSPSGGLFATAVNPLGEEYLVRVDRSTYQAAPVNPGSRIGVGNVWGLVFAQQELFGLASIAAGSGQLVTIDTLSGMGRFVRSLAFSPGGAAASSTQIQGLH
jgi:subtilisin family serine protease